MPKMTNRHPDVPGFHVILTGSFRAAIDDIRLEGKVLDHPVTALTAHLGRGGTAHFDFQILSLDNFPNLDRLRGKRATSYSLHPSALDPAWRHQLAEARAILGHQQAEEIRDRASIGAPGVIEVAFKIDPTDPKVAHVLSICRSLSLGDPAKTYSLLISCLADELIRQDAFEAQVADHVSTAIGCIRASMLLRQVGETVP